VERVEAAHRYDVPVERGFAFITNTSNWSKFWPGYVRLEEGSRWGASGDTARLVTRLLGRDRELTMTITTFEPDRLVAYTSAQPDLPDAYHERHFEPESAGFIYRLVVEYEPRRGLAGVFDRFLVERAIRRAFERTSRLWSRNSAPVVNHESPREDSNLCARGRSPELLSAELRRQVGRLPAPERNDLQRSLN
jgi:Polyketide cyclase / dehydrase and lipid transport